MSFPYAEIEKALGYTFRDKALLQEAFTHSTYANIHGGKDNERLEYLGDAVLQLVVTEWQYARDKRATEGALTRERQNHVCEEALFEDVSALGLENYLLYEGSGANLGKKTISSLFETVVGAIYLDGGYQPAREFVITCGRLEEESSPVNYKGELQETLQRKGEKLPVYESLEKSGKDNAPVFTVKATAMGASKTAKGRSKKEAEQEAARLLLDALFGKRKK